MWLIILSAKSSILSIVLTVTDINNQAVINYKNKNVEH
jgi:hypothetical protein